MVTAEDDGESTPMARLAVAVIDRLIDGTHDLMLEIARLESNAARMREYRFALEGVPTDGNGSPL